MVRKARILVISKDEKLVEIIQSLNNFGCEVSNTVYTNQLELTDLVKKEKINCIVLDAGMPGYQGILKEWEIKKYIREIPILMLTTWEATEGQVREFDAHSCWLNSSLTDSFGPEQLRERIKKI